jgi:hypothetical protein
MDIATMSLGDITRKCKHHPMAGTPAFFASNHHCTGIPRRRRIETVPYDDLVVDLHKVGPIVKDPVVLVLQRGFRWRLFDSTQCSYPKTVARPSFAGI